MEVIDRLAPGMQIARRYTILGALGQGGNASVHRAHDERLNTDIALKVLWPQLANDQRFIERFRREAQTLARLSHPNIVRMFELGDDDDLGVHYLVLEYMPGGNLKHRMSRLPWTVDQVVELLRPVASALDYAHGREPSVIHRDLKPSNILFNLEGRPVVGDFGLARLFAAEPTRTSLTGRFAVGTPMYMAPEQVKGHATPASDRYGLGIIAYELLVGRVPHQAETPIETLLLVASQPAPLARHLNSTISAEVEAVLQKALDPLPESRYGTATEFVAGLQASGLAMIGGPAVRTAYDAPGLGMPRPGRLTALTATILVGLCLAGLAVTYRRDDVVSASLVSPGTPTSGALHTSIPTSTLMRPLVVTGLADATASVPATATSRTVRATSLATANAAILTATTVPATPTLARAMAVAPTASPTPTDAQQWVALQAELDPLWGTDWPGFTQKLSTFVSAHPEFTPAKDKLYAALVEYAKDLLARGSVDDANALLQQARSLSPDRAEALDVAMALTPPPTATPTLSPSPARVNRLAVPESDPKPTDPPRPAVPPTKVPFQP